jgi:hypothetical protein
MQRRWKAKEGEGKPRRRWKAGLFDFSTSNDYCYYIIISSFVSLYQVQNKSPSRRKKNNLQYTGQVVL